MSKGYITRWKLREKPEEQGKVDYLFDSHAENAASWETKEEAEADLYNFRPSPHSDSFSRRRNTYLLVASRLSNERKKNSWSSVKRHSLLLASDRASMGLEKKLPQSFFNFLQGADVVLGGQRCRRKILVVAERNFSTPLKGKKTRLAISWVRNATNRHSLTFSHFLKHLK